MEIIIRQYCIINYSIDYHLVRRYLNVVNDFILSGSFTLNIHVNIGCNNLVALALVINNWIFLLTT